LCSDIEFLQQLFERRRSPEGIDADVVPFRAGVFAPAKVRRLFHRYSRLHTWWQNRFPVALVLIVKQLPRRHTDDSRPHAFLAELLVCLKTERNLAAGADEDDFGIPVAGIGENVGSAGQAGCRSVLRSIDGG